MEEGKKSISILAKTRAKEGQNIEHYICVKESQYMNIEINQDKKFKMMNCHVSVQHIKFKKKML